MEVHVHLALGDAHVGGSVDEVAEDVAIFVLLSLTGEVSQMTANLQGPIIINAKNRLGRQIVLKDSGYRTKHPIFPELEKDNAAGETPR